MKKSEIYTMALLAVMDSANLTAMAKLEVAELLMSEKSLAEILEKAEDEE